MLRKLQVWFWKGVRWVSRRLLAYLDRLEARR